MSRMVRYKGKLKAITKNENETIETQCKEILLKRLDNCELPNYYETYQEFLMDEFYDEYYINNGILYEINKEELELEFDIFEGSINNDGDIIFHTMFYNGGCCLSEALDIIVKDVLKK